MADQNTTATQAPDTPTGFGCPRGCASGDHCKASIAIPCPLGVDDLGETGQFQPCGCLERERCKTGCGCCLNCAGCFCGED